MITNKGLKASEPKTRAGNADAGPSQLMPSLPWERAVELVGPGAAANHIGQAPLEKPNPFNLDYRAWSVTGRVKTVTQMFLV